MKLYRKRIRSKQQMGDSFTDKFSVTVTTTVTHIFYNYFNGAQKQAGNKNSSTSLYLCSGSKRSEEKPTRTYEGFSSINISQPFCRVFVWHNVANLLLWVGRSVTPSEGLYYYNNLGLQPPIPPQTLHGVSI